MIRNDLAAISSDLRQGRHKAALKLAKAGMKRHPGNPAFFNFAGIALCALGREKEAIPIYRKALKLDPGDLHIRRNLALAAFGLKDFEQAASMFRALTKRAPEDSAAWHYLALALFETGVIAQGLCAADQANTLSPGNPEILALRAELKDRMGRTRDAISDCEAALGITRTDVALWVRLSEYRSKTSDLQGAQDAARRALELAPGNIEALRRLYLEQLASGQINDAKATIGIVLENDPYSGAEIEALARLQSPEEKQSFRPHAEAALKASKRGSEAAARIGFALAYMARADRAYEMEASLLSTANRTMAQLGPYEPLLETRRSEHVMARFARPVSKRPVTSDACPIYIVGLPRSGTTLAEAMLGAHPDVRAMGERNVTRCLYDYIDDNLPFDDAAIASFIQADAENRAEMSVNERHYIDKLAENYKMIGFLKTAYPDCALISVRRDPRDVALSMWRANFTFGSIVYTYDQKAMAHHFNLFRRLMVHWHGVFQGKILDISYEELTIDPDGISLRLADHCGLVWQPEMARPDLYDGEVRTFSAHQLRQPVHQKSVGAWRKHADMLRDFIAGLDPQLWPEITEDP